MRRKQVSTVLSGAERHVIAHLAQDARINLKRVLIEDAGMTRRALNLDAILVGIMAKMNGDSEVETGE